MKKRRHCTISGTAKHIQCVCEGLYSSITFISFPFRNYVQFSRHLQEHVGCNEMLSQSCFLIYIFRIPEVNPRGSNNSPFYILVLREQESLVDHLKVRKK